MASNDLGAALQTRRGLLAFGLVWQAVWMLADTALWPTNQSNVLEAGLLASTWLAWLLIGVVLIIPNGSDLREKYISLLVRCNVGLLGLSAIAISLMSIDPTINDWIVSASIFNLVAGLAGISIKDPEQWMWVFGFFGVELVIFIAFGFSYAGDLALSSVILYPLYALAIGIAAASAQRGIIQGAIKSEQAKMLALDRAIESDVAHEVGIRISQTQARVHETILNTLTAVARGGLPETPEIEQQMSAKASESAKVLRDISRQLPEGQPPSFSGLLEAMSDLLAEFGAREITVSFEGDIEASPPDQAKDAIAAATREALNNILRHAHAKHVSIKVKNSQFDRFRVVIKDDGTGFNIGGLGTARPGYGLTSILGTDLETVGARARVRSSTGEGTEVLIEHPLHWDWWQRLNHRTSAPTRVLVFPILVSWMAFSTANIIIAWDEYSSPTLNLLAFGLVLLFSITAILVSSAGSLPWWLVIIGTGVGFIAYELEKAALRDGATGAWVEWSSEAIAAVFFVLAAASTWWAWLVVGIAWLLIQENFPQELIAPGFGLIMSGGFLGLVLRRIERSMDASLSMAAREEVNATLLRLNAQARMNRFAPLQLEDTVALLESIAEQRVDWRSPSVRTQCAVHEAYVRNMVMSGSSAASPIMIRIAQRAKERGVIIETMSNGIAFACSCEEEVMSFLDACIDHMSSTDHARFTLLPEPDGVSSRFVVSLASDPEMWVADAAGRGIVEIDQEVESTYTLMWQIRCPAAPELRLADNVNSTEIGI